MALFIFKSREFPWIKGLVLEDYVTGFLFELQLTPVLIPPPPSPVSQGRSMNSSGLSFLNCTRKEWAFQCHGTVQEQITFCPDSLHWVSQCKLLYSALPSGHTATIFLLVWIRFDKRWNKYLLGGWHFHTPFSPGSCSSRQQYGDEMTWTKASKRQRGLCISQSSHSLPEVTQMRSGQIGISALVLRLQDQCSPNTSQQLLQKWMFLGTSLVARWLRIRLPMQWTRVRSLVWEDPTCRGATRSMCHNYWACALEPVSHNYWACEPQLLKPACLEPVVCNKRSHRNEKPVHRNEE